MADNFYYRLSNPWFNHMDNREILQQSLLAGSPAQQLFYHNMHRGVGQPCQTIPTMNRTFNGSTTSSPLSTLSCEESPDNIVSAAAGMADQINCSGFSQPSIRTAHSPGKHSPTYSNLKLSDMPMDLSKPKSCTQQSGNRHSGPSRLVDLLSRKRTATDDISTDLVQSGPLNLSKKSLPCTMRSSGQTNIVDMNDAIDNPVQLVQLIHKSQVAEKVTHFLNQMVCRVFAMQQFKDLLEADKVCLVLNSWHRLLLWIYAENKFAFQVTSLSEALDSRLEVNPKLRQKKSLHINQPSMAFVKLIATFIKKYEKLQVDEEELSLLFAITLFHSTGEESHEEPEKILRFRKSLMRQLQLYVVRKEGEASKRYPELLLYLPMLYGVNGKMMEQLFCEHLSADGGDIRIILKETIKRCFTSAPP